MPEGPLGFPRATDIGPFVDSDEDNITDESIVQAANKIYYNFNIESVESKPQWYSYWQSSDNATRGVTGSFAPELDLMVVDIRGETHHNDQLRYMLDKTGESDFEILTWAVLPSGEWYSDIPATGATMRGAIDNMDTDVTAIDADRVTEKHLWPVVYTCYLLDIPYQTHTTFRYVPERLAGIASGSDIQEEKFDMGAAYRELSFVLSGLPQPKINREQYRF